MTTTRRVLLPILVLQLLLLHQVVTDSVSDAVTHQNESFLNHNNNVIEEIPVIDLSSWTTTTTTTTTSVDETRIQVARDVRKACEEGIGFFIIRNHGVNATTLERVWESFGTFFDWPLLEKLQHQTNNESEYPYGYERNERLSLGKERDNNNVKNPLQPPEDSLIPGQTSLQPPPVDLKETFSIGPDNPLSGMPRRRPYPNLPGMKEAVEDAYSELEMLAMTLLRIFAVALHLPEHWFDDKMDHHMCALRALNYPPVHQVNSDNNDDDNNNNHDNKTVATIRAGAHTDYGAMTILKSGGPGLQAKKDSSHDHDQGEWIDVPHIPDTLIINLGDLMQRWTNDRWMSTLHRVVVPSTPGRIIVDRRQSMAFFVNINGDAVVTPLSTCVDDDHPAKYGPILAREHLMEKHLASMGQSCQQETSHGPNDEL